MNFVLSHKRKPYLFELKTNEGKKNREKPLAKKKKNYDDDDDGKKMIFVDNVPW